MFRGSLVLLWCCVACVANSDFSEGDVPDAGTDGGPVGTDCGDAGAGCGPNDNLGAQCDALVTATCGETCAESPACAAARLLQAHEPENCAAALGDTQTYPHCELGACDSLVRKVCGGDPPSDACADAPGCAPAQELLARSRDPASSQQDLREASEACVQSLEDESVFAPCP